MSIEILILFIQHVITLNKRFNAMQKECFMLFRDEWNQRLVALKENLSNRLNMLELRLRYGFSFRKSNDIFGFVNLKIYANYCIKVCLDKREQNNGERYSLFF